MWVAVPQMVSGRIFDVRIHLDMFIEEMFSKRPDSHIRSSQILLPFLHVNKSKVNHKDFDKSSLQHTLRMTFGSADEFRMLARKT